MVTGERPAERSIERGERGPLIDRVPVTHHQYDPTTGRAQLTPTAILLRRPALRTPSVGQYAA